MTRTPMLALLMLACLPSCTDDAPSPPAALPDGFLMAAQSTEEQAPTSPALKAKPEALPRELLGLTANANDTEEAASARTACDTLTIKYRQNTCFDTWLHWLTLRGGEPPTVEVAKNKSSGGRLVLGSLPVTDKNISSLRELLDLFRRGYEERMLDQGTMELTLSWSLQGEVVRTEELGGDITPFLVGDAPPPILNDWIHSFEK